MMVLYVVVVTSFLMFGTLISEKKADGTICFDCPGEANKHLDEAKKSLDSGDIEGAKKHIDPEKGLLENSTSK